MSCQKLSKVVKSWQKLLSKVGKSCQKLAKTVPFLGYIVLWEDWTVFWANWGLNLRSWNSKFNCIEHSIPKYWGFARLLHGRLYCIGPVHRVCSRWYIRTFNKHCYYTWYVCINDRNRQSIQRLSWSFYCIFYGRFWWCIWYSRWGSTVLGDFYRRVLSEQWHRYLELGSRYRARVW